MQHQTIINHLDRAATVIRQNIMKKSIYQIVEIDTNDNVIYAYSKFYLSKATRDEVLNATIASYQDSGYELLDFEQHPWRSVSMPDNSWKSATIIGALRYRYMEKRIGYITHEAE